MFSGGHTKNQIDHVMVGEHLKQSVLDVKNYRGVNWPFRLFSSQGKIIYKTTQQME